MKTTAADLMTRNVLTVAPDTPVADVAGLILEKKITSIPVVDDGGKLVGIVSEGDLVRFANTGREARRSSWLVLLTGNNADVSNLRQQSDRRVGDVMSKDVLIASEDEGLVHLVELLARKRIKRLPIVRNGKLVGIVSRVDILRHLASGRAIRLEAA